MIRPFRSVLVLAALVVAVAAPAAVSASSVDECQAAIGQLREATATATYVGKQAAKEQAGLLGKLDGASRVLAVGKYADTVKKLTDFQSHVVTIGQTGKLDVSDAAVLTELADEAIACVDAIGA